MLHSLNHVFLLLIVGIVLFSYTDAQGPPGENQMTHGIIGELMIAMRPFTKFFFEYLNAVLIRQTGQKLPCTVYNITTRNWTCTPLDS